MGCLSSDPGDKGLYDSMGEHAMLPPFLSMHSSPGSSQLLRIWQPEHEELSPLQTPHQSSLVPSFVRPLHPKQSTFSPKHTPHLSSDDTGQSPKRITECLYPNVALDMFLPKKELTLRALKNPPMFSQGTLTPPTLTQSTAALGVTIPTP
eukprot:CAMPEP_0173467536 /NCGR_PEP_ID=MMETSP1357-20121228/75216_1 /TAXON_ID=77926 /ORGANISM="Hemiselmis rufescens, Strain PCC563" /LENGTH=149 /DNA_ID=CAMNT_0014435677 /DNA_START=699 /DNA_END=1144 /DNA_ORIENTATION=+